MSMSRISGSTQISNEPFLTDDKANNQYKLTFKLNAQLLYNNTQSLNMRLAYNSFPDYHTGHLTFEDRKKLVDILSSCDLKDNYRFGSSLGMIYIKQTYRCPTTDTNMIAAVMVAESEKGERA